MRTKTLLLAAATLVIGVVCSQADAPIYSQNVVGYVNQVIPVGFSMIANQVDYDGTGTNNTLANVLPSPPLGTQLYTFVSGGYTTYSYYGSWVPNSSLTLNPGQGVFIYNPGPNPMTNTFVGTVLQGSFSNAVPSGYSIKSYNVPISGLISSNLNYPATIGDQIYEWAGTNYVTYGYYGGTTWTPSEPTINIGQSFFIYHPGGTTTNWIVNFTVQ